MKVFSIYQNCEKADKRIQNESRSLSLRHFFRKMFSKSVEIGS
ncbi:MAG: hypothetical protein RL757_1695 [Bacteroidota bacterium]|jgi:hypothetical protein